MLNIIDLFPIYLPRLYSFFGNEITIDQKFINEVFLSNLNISIGSTDQPANSK